VESNDFWGGEEGILIKSDSLHILNETDWFVEVRPCVPGKMSKMTWWFAAQLKNLHTTGR